ncbi:TIGR03619 family F420-dependent LLM class oxidoreductase [Actinomadura parmotrematis]|uniref:TIGR03619 family F420-dependent LLM class oxidoreductase n=1 Tax=Actinomadura parmotrematis TaxID=2864039 RepID=A0ABS7G437_9ACTN|nr:TIGR03619 family F420-dependent LLM class oxidoreductase [Actinomadura parmotrematis]MBW8487490.1 TIGR03619 family F420-dependent LLM class oxidoreductase [Actinomadura parmotrematis]
MTPQLSVPLPSFSADAPPSRRPLLETAAMLDRAGVDRLVVSDHVVFGEDLDAYGRPESGGTRGGVQPTGPDGHWLEPLTVLSAVAGATSRIRLATGVLLAALRRPVVLAKTAATLDVLSEGRLDLGVGVGWQRAEYEAAGLDFAERGRLLDHTLEVCRVLWSERRASYDSPGLRFEGVHMMPKPVRDGGVPVWVSGTVNPRVVRRVARFGAGWIPWGDAARDVVAGIAAMRAALEEAGHDPGGLQVTGAVPIAHGPDGAVDLARTMDAVPALAAAGVTDFRLRLPAAPDPAEAEARTRAAVAAFREATA